MVVLRPLVQRHWALLSLIGLWLALATLRYLLLSQSALTQSDCNTCFALISMKHDILLLAIFALAAAGGAGLSRWFSPLFIALQLALLLIMLADLISLHELSLRLNWRDIETFIHQPELVLDYFHSRKHNPVFWLSVLILLSILTLWLSHWRSLLRRPQQAGPILSVISFIAVSVYILPDRFSHSLPWTYQNVVHSNWPTGVDQPFSSGFVAGLQNQSKPKPAPSCVAGDNTQQDVIIVLIESWSWYHSGKLPGGMNATPRLDALMDQYAWWSDFHANGFSADQNLIALLTGLAPVPAVNRYHSQALFAGYNAGPGNLTDRLSNNNYRLGFFGAGSLAAQSQADWLGQINFDHVQGTGRGDRIEPSREDVGAIDDTVLYGRFLSWLGNEHRFGDPFLAIVETATTSPPFTHPLSGAQDEMASVGFADFAVGELYDTLLRAGYFDRGILIITSSQRALTPLRRSESSHLGVAAAARLPLMAIGDQFAGRGAIETRAQMSNLGSSLDRLLTDQSCADKGTGDLFAEPAKAPECVVHFQGNRRDVAQVLCGENYGEILLDGDDTRVLRGTIPNSAELIGELNRQRVQLGELD